MNNSFITAYNSFRAQLPEIYHQYLPIIEREGDITILGQALLDYPEAQNEFFGVFMKKLVYTAIDTKRFNNPLKFLEGDKIPLGYSGENVYVNPATGRKFNVDDFTGLLKRYEADVKIEYNHVNLDIQYPVTITRDKIRNAFTNWSNLNQFFNEIVQSLYNGAYIDLYQYTKGLITKALSKGAIHTKVVGDLMNATKEEIEDFIIQARADYLNFQEPSTEFNAWELVGGYGKPITTWTNAGDIVIFLTNDIASRISVKNLAYAFNMSETELMGRTIYVKDFNVKDEYGKVVLNGSNIQAMICDTSWFKIKKQDEALDSFFNANNRTWNYYLNEVYMMNFSLFSNAMCYVKEAIDVPATALSVEDTEQVLGSEIVVSVETTPMNATTEITATSSSDEIASVEKVSAKSFKITGKSIGNATITFKAGDVETESTATIKEV